MDIKEDIRAIGTSDYRLYAPNEKDNFQQGRNNVPAIMPKDYQTNRHYEQGRPKNSNPNKAKSSFHNVEHNSTKFGQNAQLHNTDDDSNFSQRASRNKQDT